MTNRIFVAKLIMHAYMGTSTIGIICNKEDTSLPEDSQNICIYIYH